MFASLSGAKQLKNILVGLNEKIRQTALDGLLDAAKEIEGQMRVAGSPVVYPVQWDSSKQRKAFFATNGFGRGIPTKRTGETNGAWRAIAIQDGAQVQNPLAHSVFVSGSPSSPVGRRQSRIHRGRWLVFHNVVSAVVKALPNKLRSSLIKTIKESGFDAQ